MQKFNVTGMRCAACSARVEKAVNKLNGVKSCNVSLLTNTMVVEGDVLPADIIKAVEEAGYGAGEMSLAGETDLKKNNENRAADPSFVQQKETKALLFRFLISLAALFPLIYFSMGHSMWNLPIPVFFEENQIGLALLQMLLSAIVLIINQRFFVSGTKAIFNRAPNMDSLVALGSGSSFVWSTFVLFFMTGAQKNGDLQFCHKLMHALYFESAAMVLVLITFGKMLESLSKGKTTNVLKSLMNLAPQTAVLLKDGKEAEVSASALQSGDFFVLRPGSRIPADGEVIEGNSTIDESSLTGESMPVDKAKGDRVFTGTINQEGFLKCKVTKVGKDTTLAKIIQMVSDSAATKAPVARIADKVSGIFVPVVMSIAVCVVAVWIFAGKDTGYALARGISVLVISCPCALGLATPVAIMVGTGVGAKNGILFKTAQSLEETGKAQIVVLDKTGTITEGKPEVTDVFVEDGLSFASFEKLIFAVEMQSEHPLAKAVCRYGNDKSINSETILKFCKILEFQNMPGRGVKAKINFSGNEQTEPGVHEKTIYAGKSDYICKTLGIALSSEMEQNLDKIVQDGKTTLLFSDENRLLGLVAVADKIKADSKDAVEKLKKAGIEVYMLTGDNKNTAAAIAQKVGISEFVANVTPLEKADCIKALQRKGKVIMAGDGINDAPALTGADIGMGMGSGTDIAMEACQVVLVNSSVEAVANAITISRKTLRNIHENLFWAFFYNLLGIPLAAGVFIPLFGWELSPMFGAAAMSLSSFCVVSNALRLNLLRFGKKIKKDNIFEMNKKEVQMTKTLKVEGMMCSHCEGRVKKVLEAVDGVTEAVVSHEKGTAVVTLSKEVASDLLKKAVEDADYKVLAVE